MNCVLNPEYDEVSRKLQKKTVIARKPHICGECGAEINPGTRYELYKGVYDGSIFTCKTCLDCVSIRECFFQNGISQFGTLLDDVYEHIVYELAGEVDSRCIIPLTDTAKKRIFAYIQEAWERQ